MISANHPPADTASADRYYRVLGSRARRLALHVLSEYSSMSLDELATEFAARSTEVDEPTAKISLYHHHLPALADAGLLTHEDYRDEIALIQPAFDDLTELRFGAEWDLEA